MPNYPLGLPEALIILLMGVGIIPVAIFACLIFKKAGYHWALGLLTFVPLANLIILIYFAIDRWPVLRELEQLKSRQGPLS
ncbi:hypothetical protein JW998_11520 [candidate division KSB1 bacterium]|nr:hypothetical protein [candidate division KSB1 bacterium]